MFQLAEVNSELENECLLGDSLNGGIIGVPNELFCDVVWDSVYCWPPTLQGTLVKIPCSEIFWQSYSQYAKQLQGYASRECLDNGTWAQGNQSNYDECAESFHSYLAGIEENNMLIPFVHHMVFFGSVLSLICLGASLAIFYTLRCLKCDRITVYSQLMLSLVLRFVVMLIIAESFVIGHRHSYRDVEILCKIIHSLFLYFTFSSTSWMFVQGLFLNLALMAGVVTIETRHQLTIYYIIGWGVPAGFVGVYVVFMTMNSKESCWEGYSDMIEIWIVLGPILVELVVNGVFLLNILRILLQKIRSSNSPPYSLQFKAAAKATVIFFPVLGINNLVLLYNPGGDYNKYFVILNTFFSSTQGIFVSIVFCFADKEVRAAIWRSVARAKARRIEISSPVQRTSPPELTTALEILSNFEVTQSDNNMIQQSA